MDHLDGILHMDISKKIIVMPAEERQTHGYKIINKEGNFESLK